jgi:hypothetical protein
MEDYIYNFAGVVGAVCLAVGAIVLGSSRMRLLLARIWFWLGAAALAAIPITFGITTNKSLGTRLAVVGISGACLGALLYGLMHATSRGAIDVDSLDDH